MSKQNILIISLLCLLGILKSQDLIVTIDGDSINCKIKKIEENGTLHFRANTKIANVGSILNKDYYTNYQKKHFLGAGSDEIIGSNLSLYRWGISLSGGFYNTSKIDIVTKDILNFNEDYVKELKSGKNLHISIIRSLSDKMGLGITVNQLSSKFSQEISYWGDNFGDVEVDIMTTFIALGFQQKLNISQSNLFYLKGDLGFDAYQSKIIFDKKVSKVKSFDVVLQPSLIYVHLLTNNLGINVNLSASITKRKQYDAYLPPSYQRISYRNNSSNFIIYFSPVLGITYLL